jgi:RNA polymerase sigma-70 factor (ECF subfamily)
METTVRLLRLAKQGDRQAFGELYARYWERLLTIVRLRLGPALRAKLESADIVQEALLASLRGIDRFEYRSEGDFLHWLCRLVENRIRDQADYFNAQKRRIGREVPLQVQLPSRTTVLGPLDDVGALDTPSQDAVRREELEALERAIDRLPPEQREAVILTRYEGLSYGEASGMLERSPDAVRMLVSRAMVTLAKELRP